MTVWTIQEYSLYEKLLKNKILTVDLSYSEYYNDCKEFKNAYDWLYKQFKKRVKKYDGNPLWWGWTDRPDLRKKQTSSNDVLVLIELNIPDELILKSDFCAWEYAFTDSIIAESEKEYDIYYDDEENWTEDVKKQKEMVKEKSWEIIFNKNPPKNDWIGNTLKWQVNFEYLKLSEVKSIKIFNK
jgi:hypothetical protein